MVEAYMLLLTAVLYQATIYVYNIFFHPLRHVPGPLFWRISRIPHELALIRGNVHYRIRDFHEKYGDNVRVSPNGLSFAHPDAWNDMMVRDPGDGGEIPVKDMLRFTDSLRVNGAPEMLTADAPTHARQRKAFDHAFGQRALRKMSQQLIQGHTRTLVEQLRRRLGEQIDLVKWFSLYNFEVISDFSLGEPLGCLSGGEYHPWTKLLFESVVTMTVLGSIRQFPWVQAVLDLLLVKIMTRLIRQHQQFAIDKVNKRLETKDVSRGDLFDQIFKVGAQAEMSTDELMANCNLMIAAGSDTTGAALSSCMFMLVSNKETYIRLTKEIRGRFKYEEEITMDSSANIEYLEACIKEAMRLYPPNPNTNPRRGSKKGSMAQGIWIDEHTTVGIYHWAANHYSRNFKYPDKFDPSRWLGSSLYQDDRRGMAKPFSVGLRNCIGQQLAMSLIRMAICQIIFSFDVELMDESHAWLDQKTYWVWKKIPLWVLLREQG